MIKYVELTAPETSAFRQAKILSIECKEGERIKEGDTLFRVQSGPHEINLPATKSGKVVELIVEAQENITLSTALLLLETVVEGRTASTPITSEVENEAKVYESAPVNTEPTITMVEKANVKSAKKENMAEKKHQQQSLDLSGEDLYQPKKSVSPENSNINEVVLTQKAPLVQPDVSRHTQTSKTMSSNSIVEISVPDIGSDTANVIEILVKVGDSISIDDPLVTLESDKASMDVPSTHSGVITAISVEIDQEVSEGTVILALQVEAKETDQQEPTNDDSPAQTASETTQSTSDKNEDHDQRNTDDDTVQSSPTDSQIIDVRIPDIGGDSAKVIDILVNVGDRVAIEDPLVTLESDKASMDVPSSDTGFIKSIEVSLEQDVSEGTVVVTIESDITSSSNTTRNAASNDEGSNNALEGSVAETNQSESIEKPLTTTSSKRENQQSQPVQAPATAGKSHASPSIRRFARELGVDLSKVNGTGRKGRITQEDVKAFVKDIVQNTSEHTSRSSNVSEKSDRGIPAVPAQDFSKFGEIEVRALNKIKRLTAENLHRSWLNVPHVTHSDESNISDLESFRKQLNTEYAQQKRDIKLSPLAFIVKAVVNALQQFPQFNSSLEPGGENLIYKKYFNIGIAVETPNGLVVPVVKDADKKSVAEIAREMGELAKKARDKKLTMTDMTGACFTISSLGGIGGTHFTPIVNSPEVAILGVSRSKIQPVWNGSEFEPGMILPLSLSYDHRVIDGAEAARFTRHIAAVLEDVRRLTV